MRPVCVLLCCVSACGCVRVYLGLAPGEVSGDCPCSCGIGCVRVRKGSCKRKRDEKDSARDAHTYIPPFHPHTPTHRQTRQKNAHLQSLRNSVSKPFHCQARSGEKLFCSLESAGHGCFECWCTKELSNVCGGCMVQRFTLLCLPCDAPTHLSMQCLDKQRYGSSVLYQQSHTQSPTYTIHLCIIYIF